MDRSFCIKAHQCVIIFIFAVGAAGAGSDGIAVKAHLPKGAHGTGQSVGIAGGETEAVKARLHRRTHIAQTAGQHRGAQSVGLGGDKGEALVAKAGGDNGAAFGHAGVEFRAGELAQKLHVG